MPTLVAIKISAGASANAFLVRTGMAPRILNGESWWVIDDRIDATRPIKRLHLKAIKCNPTTDVSTM
jgi:hypothetical protein